MTEFYDWLMRQMRRDDPVGRFARHVQGDRYWPMRTEELGRFSAHIKMNWSDPGVDLLGLSLAWVEFRLDRPTQRGRV